MKRDLLETTGIVSVVVGFIGLFVFSPIIVFGFAYIGGLILKLFVGSAMAHGICLLFNTDRFSPNDIPLFCAIFATIGKYFKSSQTNNNSKKEEN